VLQVIFIPRNPLQIQKPPIENSHNSRPGRVYFRFGLGAKGAWHIDVRVCLCASVRVAREMHWTLNRGKGQSFRTTNKRPSWRWSEKPEKAGMQNAEWKKLLPIGSQF